MNLKQLDLEEDFLQEIFEILSNPEHGTVFENYQTHQFYLLRRLSLKDGEVSYIREAYLIEDKKVSLINLKTHDLTPLKKDWEDFLERVEKIYTFNHSLIVSFSEEIEKLETSLFERSPPAYFMDIWFDLKKHLSKIESYCHRSSMVYKEFFKTFDKEAHFQSDDFKDVDEQIFLTITYLQNLKSRLDSLHHYHKSIHDARLNKTLLMLTIISGIFLPLNLIVGFFGINTPGLFFGEDPNGTRYVVYILAGIFCLAILGVPLLKTIDKYILKFLLGRYDFYTGISSKISSLEETFKVKI